MSADMLIVGLATNPTTEIDWDAAEAALDRTASIEDFDWDDYDLRLTDFDPEDLGSLIAHGHTVLKNLRVALDSYCTATHEIGGYRVYLSGGLSWGDAPSDEYTAIAAAYGLPEVVLSAAGFIPDHSGPLSRRAGNQGAVTDTDVVDAIALGLGTKSEWSSDELEWIPELIGTVRPHPGELEPVAYLAQWQETFGPHALDDAFLRERVDDEAYGSTRP